MAKPVIVDLSLSMVESGGNTGMGKYFYSFTPDLLVVEDGSTQITYQFTSETPSTFVIEDVFSNDPRTQLTQPKIAPDQRSASFTHFNTVPSLVFLSFLVKDTSTGARVSCDPQITNIPGQTP